MEIYQLIVLDKLYEKFKAEQIDLWSLKQHLAVAQRIPKDKIRLIIADLLEHNYLLKTDRCEFKLKEGIESEIEQAIKKYNLMRNRVFLE